MKDEMKRLKNLREKHKIATAKLDDLEAGFVSAHCRYRNDNATCGHGRYNMKKHPQHVPTPPKCNPMVCPRN